MCQQLQTLIRKMLQKMTDQIYFNNKAGSSREEVSLSLRNLSQQTGASKKALAELTESSSKIAQLMNADQAEVDRAFSSMYNNLKLVWETKRRLNCLCIPECR